VARPPRRRDEPLPTLRAIARLATHLASGDVVLVIGRTVDLGHILEPVLDLDAERTGGEAAAVADRSA
jgi:hypothetical protein